jgi:hypothetical protein
MLKYRALRFNVHEEKSSGIEEYQKNIIVRQRKVLKIWENYVTEIYDPPYRPD